MEMIHGEGPVDDTRKGMVALLSAHIDQVACILGKTPAY
jgi:hypothetical protein